MYPGIKGNVDLDFGYFALKEAAAPDDTSKVEDSPSAIHEGDTVRIRQGARYKGGIDVPARLYGVEYTAGRAVGESVYIAELNSWVEVEGLEGVKQAGADYAELVCERCGLEEQTREYLDAYRYAPELWRKLWTAMC